MKTHLVQPGLDGQTGADDRQLAQICKALGNPVRLQIVRYVLEHPGCIGNQILLHLPANGPHAQSTISRHLRILCEADLLEAEADGSAVCYWVQRECFDWLRDQFAVF